MVLNTEQLKEEAHKSALKHDPFIKRKAPKRFWKVNQADIENLRSFVSQLREKSSSCSQPAEEWLLDNAEFIDEQIMVMNQELTRKNLSSLPHLSKTREARAFSICLDYLKHVDGNINLDSFITYIHSYQEVAVLKMTEVWAIPMFMRMALIRRLSEIMNILKDRHVVCTFVEKLLSDMGKEITPERLSTALEEAGYEIPLSGPMIVHLVTHLRERADYTATVGEWLICKLENGPESLDHILSYEYQLQASLGLTTGNIITSLRKLSRWNWHDAFEQISYVEQTLRKECTNTYSFLDFTSRETLRKRVEYLSGRFHLPENLIAMQAVEIVAEFVKNNEGSKTDHLPRQAYVAYYLLEPEGTDVLREELKKCGKPKVIRENGLLKHSTPTYFNTLAVSFIVSLIIFSIWVSKGEFFSPLQWLFILIALSFPAMEWAVTFVHWMIERVKKPVPLLRYDLSRGVPEDAATMVIIPVIWSTVEEVNEMAERLELHYLANNYPNIHFALLSDFKDAESETLPQDEVIIHAAKKKINELNRSYKGAFHLYQRKRKWNSSEGAWMGWERKRGKLVEFVDLIKGNKNTSFIITDGDLSFLKKVRYIITLDADTKLPLESAQRMIGTLHYPYNKPRLNKAKTRVIEGYGVLQPRIGLSHEATMKTRLSKLWSADPGVDPYAFAVSDAYQDGLDQGIFTGKGIFDVDSFYQVLCERIPENRVLSHDLLEGGFLRTGLLSNIELIDDHPSRYSIYQRRLHRWVRGDWQLLLWLFPKSQNRKGELVPVDLSILTRWQILDNLRRSLLTPALFAILLFSLLFFPDSSLRWFAVVAGTWLLPVLRQFASLKTVSKDSKGLLYTAGQVLVSIITVPYQSIVLLNAIFRTLYRLFVSKRHLLEWVTSADEERKNKHKNLSVIHGMFGGLFLTTLFLLATFFNEHTAVKVTGLLLTILWVSAPFVINWLDKPLLQNRVKLSEEETTELHKLSHDIWSFYEDYVTKEDNWLPPDNVQMDPPNGIAHRTSPTNIGLYMTCALAARDFSFIDAPEFIKRLENTLDTLDKLEKWNGHLYNWYDTVTLKPLTPIYVSTVDSGNFVGCLITVKEGLREWLELNNYEDSDYPKKDPSLHIAFSEELTPIGSGKVLSLQLKKDWLVRGKQLMERLDKWIMDTDFRPLYDHNAKLFSLGYHVEQHQRDEVLYDLMASEARQASFVSIALGQVSVSHWNTLGRTMTKAGKKPLLLSWSGTMFEYLMPWLFMRSYRDSLWDATYSAVVNRQIEYASQRGVPFGISESGYYAFDYQMNYQYRAFGVPGLGFKRGLEKDLVVAPYATILAMPFAKDKSLEALRKIEKINGRGKYGFYEAIDFTKERLPEDKSYMVIRSFMAHHQGMSLLALANLLLPKPIYERFHQNKYIRSAELLLQERIPKKPKLIKHPAMNRIHDPITKEVQDVVTVREYPSPNTQVPEVCVLSNGTLSTIITNTGSGLSLYKGLHVSRWREDPVMDPWGSYVYIRDITNDLVWSPSFQPCQIETPEQMVQFHLDRATFTRTMENVKTTMEVTVSPECNAEVRRISITNMNDQAKVIEVTTYTELALANPIADEAHTAFSKLFIRTSFDKETGCLVAGRRTREKKDQVLWSAHSLMVEGNTLGTIEYETDRSSFIGRGYRLSEPQSIRTRLRGKIGSVADPAFVMRRRVNIKPGETIHLAAITSVSETKEDAINIVRRFNPDDSIERAFQMAWNRAQIELRHLHVTSQEAGIFQTLAGQILYRPPRRKEQEQMVLKNKKGQSGLWSFGISGDRPIILVRIDDQSQIPFVVKILTGHEYLRRMGFIFDLILLNESIGGYQQNLQEALQRTAEHGVDRFGEGLSGVYAIPANQLSEEDITLLMAVSRVILQAGGASLKAQLRLPVPQDNDVLPEKLIPVTKETQYSVRSVQNSFEDIKEWQFFNGWGGFSPDGKEYRILIKNGNYVPAPWINVLSNPKFGCLISEMGTGYTWWRNSREFKLTPWSNDPVLDAPTETAFIRDEDSGIIWPLTPSAVKSDAPYKVTHGHGFTSFEHERNGIMHDMTVYVPLHDPVKIMRVKLQNKTSAERKISLTYYAEWVLGVLRPANASHIVTEWLETANIMTARNTYQEIFRESTAFMGLFPQHLNDGNMEKSWTADRLEFIGRNGSMEHPEALTRVDLSCRTGTFHETCGAVQNKVTLMPNSEQVIYIILGCEDSNEAVLNLAQKYSQPEACEEALEEIHYFWEHHLGQITVSTPSKETNLLLNGWLLYQSLACRIWARTAFYQAGGAYGFRDQLQDSLSMLHTLPELTRKQILLHAAHQYLEGDVQHWWHEETERGIRTFFTDDLLWLPYTVSRYVEHTGDQTLLNEVVPYLYSEPLKEDEHERYEPTQKASESGAIFEHCVRAIDKALSRIGEHGIPLMGVGDWNDGMNLVGANGRGESVWLGWFICDVLSRFVPICNQLGETEKAKAYELRREQIISSINEHAWDGQWYRRAFTDDGTWLGSIENKECQIDAIAQSWSVISGGAPEERAVQAMNSFDRELVEKELSIIRLLTPAFDETEPSPGYIQGYPPGIRENGAQYTHGVIWGIVAWCLLDQGDHAHEMFNILNPINHTRTDLEVRRYVGEPYAIAADVYTAEPNAGHAGWTWYTGAAGWLYQAGMEWILGMKRRENRLFIDPKIPNEWPGFSLTYRFGKTNYIIEVKNKGGMEAVPYLKIDEEIAQLSDEKFKDGPFIELVDDGKEHHIELKL